MGLEKRILIIDDDPDIWNYFAKFFRVLDSSIILDEDSTLVSAVDLLEKEKVSLILLDLKLEYEMGVEFLKFREGIANLKKFLLSLSLLIQKSSWLENAYNTI